MNKLRITEFYLRYVFIVHDGEIRKIRDHWLAGLFAMERELPRPVCN